MTMSNMSYCRFTNTGGDLEACLDAIRQDEQLSHFEIRAGTSMFKSFLNFCRDYDIISDFDKGAVESIFKRLEERDDGHE